MRRQISQKASGLKAVEQTHMRGSIQAMYYIKATNSDNQVFEYWRDYFNKWVKFSDILDDSHSKIKAFITPINFVLPLVLLWFNFWIYKMSVGLNLAAVGLGSVVYLLFLKLTSNVTAFQSDIMTFRKDT